MKPEDIMTDKQVAKLLHLSTEVFQRKCRDGFAEGEIDLLAAQPITLGKSRRWFREEVERVLRKKITVAPKAQQEQEKEVVNG